MNSNIDDKLWTGKKLVNDQFEIFIAIRLKRRGHILQWEGRQGSQGILNIPTVFLRTFTHFWGKITTAIHQDK